MDTILKDSSILELQKKVFAVIGHASSEVLHTFGITAQVVSKEETAQGLLKTLLELMSVQGMKILFPRSSLPNPFLKDALRQQGAEVYEWTVYFNVKPEWRSLPDQLIHGIVFTSPSTVKNFLADYKAIPPQLEILAKGPVTQTALTEAGYTSRIIR